MNHRMMIALSLALLTPALAAPNSVSYGGVHTTLDTQQRADRTYLDAQAFVKAFRTSLNVKALPSTVSINGRPYAEVNSLAKALGLTVAVSRGTLVFAKVSGPAVMGTAQRPGDAARPGQEYTVGRQNPMNFILRGAEFSVGRANVGGGSVIPTREQKLLIVHYTLHNPQQQDLLVRSDQLKLTAVDAQDVNHDAEDALSREGQTTPLELQLKPGQRIDVVTAILVPATGPVPKLIVQPLGDDHPAVLRYDLRGVVKPLPAALSTPNDPVTAPAVIPAALGTTLPLGYFDAQVKGVTYTRDTLTAFAAPEDGQQVAVVALTLKNAGSKSQFYRGDVFPAEVTLDNGERVKFTDVMVRADRNADAEGELRPGEQLSVRLLGLIPDGRTVASVTLSENVSALDGLTHAFTVRVK
ncbi:hypothetical protein [Deinococcus sonorensis]|uniref:Uncharacterized protein n=2 Tax=Deinococcus sonorensis TaxID=309891 RepID=A0AAU7UCG4_9DEIO